MAKNDDWILPLAAIGTGTIIGLVLKNNLELHSRGFASELPAPQAQLDTIASIPQIPAQHPQAAQHKRQQKKNGQVHAHVECPSDLHRMKCGANCYKDGKLWKIVCSEAERRALYPSEKKTKKKGTINVPPGSTVVYTPQGGDITQPGEEPYPSDEEYFPPGSITEPSPDQTPDETGTVRQPQPQVTSTMPPPTTQQPAYPPVSPAGPGGLPPGYRLGRTFTDFEPKGGSIVAISPAYTRRGCGMAHVGGTLRDSCRYEKTHGVNFMNYRVDTTVAIGNKTDQVSNSENRLEITSGGPGIGHGGCCGFSICYNLSDGTLHVEDENWTGGHHQNSKCICEDSTHSKCHACTSKGNSISAGKSLYNRTIAFTWQVYHQNGHVFYEGFVNGKKVYAVTDPRGSQGVIDPAYPISPSRGHEKDYDPYNTVRIRLDGSRDTIISGSKVTELVPSTQSYRGELGYIDEQSIRELMF